MLFIKATEPNLLVLHINDRETAIFQISGLEKEGRVIKWKSSETSIILLFIVTVHCSERLKPKGFGFFKYTYLQNHHYQCLLDWLWTLQTWPHMSHSRWALCSVLPSLPPEGKQSQWHINKASSRWPGILLKMLKLPWMPIYNPTEFLGAEASIIKDI